MNLVANQRPLSPQAERGWWATAFTNADHVPTITIGTDFDGPNKDGASYCKMFTGPCSHHVLDGIGHNVQQEAPLQFTDAIIAADGH